MVKLQPKNSIVLLNAHAKRTSRLKKNNELNIIEI